MYETYDSFMNETATFKNPLDLMEYAQIYADRIADEGGEKLEVGNAEEAISILESAMVWTTKIKGDVYTC